MVFILLLSDIHLHKPHAALLYIHMHYIGKIWPIKELKFADGLLFFNSVYKFMNRDQIIEI